MSSINQEFISELRAYSVDDLELIKDTQQDLYTEDEMKVIYTIIEEKRRALEKEQLTKLPTEIKCHKCDGPNPFQNEQCQFCGCKLDKQKYYDLNFQSESDEDIEGIIESNGGYGFQYIVSFLIPLIGLILGAILLSKEDIDSCSHGKVCIVLGIISMLISSITAYNIIF